MNCKQGDLAIVVRSRVGLEGTIVRCVKLWPIRTMDPGGIRITNPAPGPRWRIDPPVKVPVNSGEFRQLHSLADACLKPLRGDGPIDVTQREVEAAG